MVLKCLCLRRFFSMLIQRAAKAHRRRGGGSLTLVMVLPGCPASGASRRPCAPAAGYRHLSDPQRQKLEAALSRQTSHDAAAEIADGVRTEVKPCSSWPKRRGLTIKRVDQIFDGYSNRNTTTA